MSTYWPPQDLKTWLKSFRFFIPIQVRFSDTDMLGHINNVSYFSYFEYGRLAYIKELNLADQWFTPHNNQKYTWVVAHQECQYLSQVYYGKDIRLGVRTSRIGNSSMDIEYVIYLPEDQTIASIGRSTMVQIEIKTGKSSPLSEEVKTRIQQFESHK